MYRIKTDIRQFKCDTREKVEKLIRNWVIRPTDLLYHRDQKIWTPIGDSDEFEPIFQQIKDSSEDDEETIVTAREDSPAALFDDEDEDEVEEDDPDAEAARARPAAAVLRPSKSVSRKSAPKPLPIPEAPAGVEQVVRDHEVTVMTERTADLLGLSDSDEHMLEDIHGGLESDEDSEPQLTRGDLPEELFLTNEFSSSDPISAPEDAVLDELGDASSVDDAWAALSGLDENSAFGDGDGDGEDERATIELDVADIKLEDRRRRQSREEDDEVTVITRTPRAEAEAEADGAPKEPSSTVFVDASYSTDGPDELQDEPLLDEPLLEDLPAPASPPPRRDLLSLEDLPRAVSTKGLGDLTDLPAPATSAPDGGSDLPAPVTDLPAPADDLPRPVSDLPRPVSDDAAPPEAPILGAEGEPLAADGSAEPLDAAPDAGDLSGPDSEAIEDALDALSASDEEAAEEDLPELDVEPVDDDAFEDLLGGDEPEVAKFVQDRDFVSEGYQLELPYRVAPTPEDIASGVKRSTATTAQKNKAFPYPQPKKIGEVQLRYYGDEPDHSLFYVGVGVLVLVLLIVTLAILMNLG